MGDMAVIGVTDERVPEGVYLGMSPARYFRQPAMGSSDWMKLHLAKEGWWMQSRHNPNRVEKTTDALLYGTALHAIMLEGVAAYEAGFAILPNRADYVDLVTTVPEMKAALAAAGYDIRTGKSGYAAADWAREMRINMPDTPCWPTILEEAAAVAGDRPQVSALDDQMLRFMLQVATDKKRRDNRDVRRLFADDPDHPPLVEVSVFAEVDDIWRRWRFDKMLPAATMDLKSLGGWKGRPLPFETGEVMARRCWDIQRADYHDGRLEAYRLIREGKLFGGSIEQRRYIQEIAEEQPKFDFIWLVYQKPDPAGVAAVLMPVWDDTDSPIHEWGRNKLAKAKQFYQSAVAEFGLDQPWARVEPLHYTDENQKLRIIPPHWMADTTPADAAAYDGGPK
jgi:hypothetical protein